MVLGAEVVVEGVEELLDVRDSVGVENTDENVEDGSIDDRVDVDDDDSDDEKELVVVDEMNVDEDEENDDDDENVEDDEDD